MSTPAPMCECISKINARLKQDAPNTVLVTNLFGLPRCVILTSKERSDIRGKPAILMATYCPFCGAKYQP